MITRREACFVILTVALSSVSAFHCPTNQKCICQSYLSTDFKGIKINCAMKNNSAFTVNIKSNIIQRHKDNLKYGNPSIQIGCIKSTDWSDFRINMTVLTKNENIKSLHFSECDLPSNNSLGEIARILGSTDVKELHFRSNLNMNSAVVKHHLDDFKNLKYLNLQINNSYVDKDLLVGLVNLTELHLSKTNLHLVAKFFNYTPELKWFDLVDNSSQSIELGPFDNLKNLRLLYLLNNHLTELQSGIFNKLAALQTLVLKDNDMVQLPKDIFAKLEDLRFINLSKNNFTYLPRNMLRNNVKLQKVFLYNNKRNMTILPKEFFANLTKLKMLVLAANGFVTLPEDLFWGCTSLTIINLERNNLQTLPVHIFRDLKKLKELQLNFNDLETLPDHIFSNTNQLVKLDLSKNRITSISKHLFNGLYALKELNMEENRLMTISHCGFSSLTKLKIAKLSKNHLTLEETFHGCPDEYGTKSPFHDCVSLEELYLANNSISKIFSDWLLSDLQLRKLDLKYNNISTITTEDVQFVWNKIEVDLTHNKIEHIILNSAEKFVNYHNVTRNAIILVDDNPLHCDCRLYDFLRYIEGKMDPKVQNYSHIKPGNLTCQSPEELENVRVKDLKSENLTCVVDPNMCPEKCNCFEKPEDNAFIFNCSQRNLTSVPSDIKKPPNHFRIELNFSGNRLTRMPDLKAMGFESVKKVILSHNWITEISLDGLSSTIQVLELHNNNVPRVHPDVLEFLKNSTNLTRLTLHENPWECDCDAKEFQSFIQNPVINVKISALLNIKCVESNISVWETTDFCAANTAMMIGVSITISFTGFLIGFIGLYYKYQRQIKVWLFAHQWCLWFVTEEELDKEKLYDAFVSYSHKDEDFVENELVSKLENGSTPFKLCLHYRDWLAGEWIPANIATSVENSRRTIVVLSPNFLESIWGRMEFRAAHSQALNEGRARVILILYGDIGPTDNLDSELKAYISMNTYIKWGDPWFWDKLKYALPHQPKLSRHSVAGKKIFENHQLCIQENGDKKEFNPIGFPETPPTITPPDDIQELHV